MRKFQSAVQGLKEMIERDSVFSNSFFWLHSQIPEKCNMFIMIYCIIIAYQLPV